jgi:hypothetical protein
MKKELSPEVAQILARVSASITGRLVKSVHIVRPRICDHCKNDDDEAFPYRVYDKDGRLWQDLCNSCFDSLGCSYPDEVST